MTLGLVAAAGLAALGASTAAPASAAFWVQGIPGATCSHTNNPQEGQWRIDGRRFRNLGTGPLDIFLVACPITLVQPGWDPVEYRVQLTDSQRRDAYCNLYRSNGAFLRTDWTDWDLSSILPIQGPLDPPLGYSSGWVELTLQCLLHPGTSLERIEIVWETSP
jgi:hypothetical protein